MAVTCMTAAQRKGMTINRECV